jgi:uncharacterized protein (TIGR02466 family)
MSTGGFMMDSIPTHHNQHDVFNTPVWGFVLRDHHYESQDYIDYILELKANNDSLRKSNFNNGWHSECNLFEHGIFKELSSQLLGIATDVAKPYVQGEFKFLEMWAMVNTRYSYNAHHIHEGVLSGVFYLQTPKDCGRLILCNPAVRSHSHPIRCKDFAIEPDRLALIMFPSWLEHYVEPSQTDEERIAISFNIGIK